MSSPLRSDATALAAVAALLGPDGADDAAADTPRPDAPAGEGAPTRAYAVLPRPTRPRYLVPVAGRHARGAHIRPGAGTAQAATRTVLRTALRAGAGRVLPGRLVVADGDAAAPSLRRHLAALLDRPDVDLAVALGAPRPNRKPVLQVIGADGATVAWVKLGVDAHTDALVAHESSALAAVADRPGLTTPPVLATGTWQGHPLLALGHVTMDESAASLALTAEAVRAIAGPVEHLDVLASGWWQGLRSGPDPDGHLAALLDALEPGLAGRRWPFGRWHGDLAPWNATRQGAQLVAWDWERSEASVPLGLDLVHNRFQPAVIRDGGDVLPALRAAAAAEATTLVALGHDRADAPLVAAAYAATLRARYAADAVHGGLGPGARVAAAIDADPTLGREVPAP